MRALPIVFALRNFGVSQLDSAGPHASRPGEMNAVIIAVGAKKPVNFGIGRTFEIES